MQAPDITAGRGGLSALHNAAQYSHAATQAGNAATMSALQATKSIYDLWNTRREIGRQREQDKQAAERHDIEMQAAQHKLDIAKKYDEKQAQAGIDLTKAQTSQAYANTRNIHANAASGEISNKQNAYELGDLMIYRDIQENGGKLTKATATTVQQVYDKAGLTTYDKNKRPINTAYTRLAELNAMGNRDAYFAELQKRHNPAQNAQHSTHPLTPSAQGGGIKPAQDFLATGNLVAQTTPPATQNPKTAFGINDASKSPMARK